MPATVSIVVDLVILRRLVSTGRVERRRGKPRERHRVKNGISRQLRNLKKSPRIGPCTQIQRHLARIVTGDKRVELQ